jgi:hypothetical protein
MLNLKRTFQIIVLLLHVYLIETNRNETHLLIIQNRLSQIEQEISHFSFNDLEIRLPFIRLFEHSIKNDIVNLTQDSVSLLPSISLPFKENVYYSIMIRKNNGYYTLKG